jgi:hypothetical protein
VVSCTSQQGQRLLIASCRVVEPPAQPVEARDAAGHQGRALIVTSVFEQLSCSIEVPASRVQLQLNGMEPPSEVQHRGLTAHMVRLPGGRQGDVSGLPPVVEVGPGLKEGFRAVRQAPAQLHQPCLGRLPYPGDQRCSFAVIPGQGIADQFLRQPSGQRPPQRVALRPEVAAAVVTAVGLLGEIEQGTERTLQRRLLFGPWLLGGEALARTRGSARAGGSGWHARSGARGLDQLGIDQLVEQVLGVGDRLVEQRRAQPAREHRHLQQRQPA